MDEKSNVDLVTVHESSVNPPEDELKDGINSFRNLAIEATLINEFLKEQLIDTEQDLPGIEESNPFSTGDEDQVLEKLAYRYRMFHLVRLNY
jgi:hypothetical protein